jgi:hypothetical protein
MLMMDECDPLGQRSACPSTRTGSNWVFATLVDLTAGPGPRGCRPDNHRVPK